MSDAERTLDIVSEPAAMPAPTPPQETVRLVCCVSCGPSPANRCLYAYGLTYEVKPDDAQWLLENSYAHREGEKPPMRPDLAAIVEAERAAMVECERRQAFLAAARAAEASENKAAQAAAEAAARQARAEVARIVAAGSAEKAAAADVAARERAERQAAAREARKLEAIALAEEAERKNTERRVALVATRAAGRVGG